MSDDSNITCLDSVENITSEEGKKFYRMKYCPKVERIKKHFNGDIKDKSILDVGIGYGAFLNFLEKEGHTHLFGMDPFPKSIDISKNYTSANIQLGKIENPEWPFKQKFDIITCFDVVEHLEDTSMFFKHAKQYLAENGIIVIATPNKQLPYYLRSLPFIGIPDTNTSHINVKHYRYWLRLANSEGYDVIEKWKGEYLTHIKFLPNRLMSLFSKLNIDHRKLPLINALEQSFNMIIQPKKLAL